MKTLALVLLVITSTYAQKSLRNQLVNRWIKNDITAGDGSKIYNNELKNINFEFNFISKDSVYIVRNGSLSKNRYSVFDSSLTISGINYKIIKLNDIELALKYIPEGNVDSLIFYFTPKKLADLTFTPNHYTSKSGEVVYENIPGKLEPYFLSKSYTSMDFIAEKFAFPEYKKGGFVVRFVITKNGQLTGARVVATSNDRYNPKLIEAVESSTGKWLPANYLGENVNVEVQYDFNMGYTDDNPILATDSLKYSDMYYGYGNDFFEEKSYRQAESYYAKAISYNALNIGAYFQRAACNIFLRKKEEACADYKQLIFLEQEKAKTLFKKYCE